MAAYRLKEELGQGFTPLLFDVTDAAAIMHAAQAVRVALARHTLTGLVNNAGMHLPGPCETTTLDSVRQVMEVNFVGVLAVTQAFLPLLGTDLNLKGPPGRIIKISSMAGRSAVPLPGAYTASKFALEGLSETLRREVFPLYGIRVIVIAPGPVTTPAIDKFNKLIDEKETEAGPYTGIYRSYHTSVDQWFQQGVVMPVTDCATTIANALEARWPRTRYDVVSWA